MDVTLPRWHTREDSGLVLDAELGWWHDGQRVEHPGIVEAFNRGLRLDEAGRYRLEVGSDWCYVEVQGPAYAVVCVDGCLPGALSVRLSDRTAENLVAEALFLDGGVFHCRVKQGRCVARFSRQAQLQLGEQLGFEEGHWLWPTAHGSVVLKFDQAAGSGGT